MTHQGLCLLREIEYCRSSRFTHTVLLESEQRISACGADQALIGTRRSLRLSHERAASRETSCMIGKERPIQ